MAYAPNALVGLKPPRTFPTINAIMCLRMHIKQASPDATRGQVTLVNGVVRLLGVLPKGSIVLPPAKHVITAFDGTTPTIDVGTIATPNGFIPTAQIAPGAIAFAGNLAGGTLMGFQTDDTPVYVTLTCANNTVGELDILLPFYVPQD